MFALKSKVETVLKYLKECKTYNAEAELTIDALNVLAYLNTYELLITYDNVLKALKAFDETRRLQETDKELFNECFYLNE